MRPKYYTVTNACSIEKLLKLSQKDRQVWRKIVEEKIMPTIVKQLKDRIDYLEKDKEILERQLKSKQIVIDIKTKEAKNLKHVVDLLLDAASLASMAVKERG